MDVGWSSADQAFRQEVREFTQAKLPAEIRDKVIAGRPLERSDHMQWQDILAEKGWIAGFWPSKFGGHDWTPAQSYIFQEETTYAGAPWLLPFGVNYVGPVIYTYGSEAQKARHLPGIVSNEVFWCQGYSEPNAGSDLAQLSTRADRDGDAYVVNGSKIWTSMAHWADWIFALVRTDSQVKPQRGISFLLIDLRTPGITVRPIRSIEGAHHLNQVFFDNVRVPVENLVGEENAGWGYAKFLLGHERVLSAEIGKGKRMLDRLRSVASAQGRSDDPGYLERLNQLETDLLALEWTTLRMLDAVMDGSAPGFEASVLKLRGSTIVQRIAEYTVDTLGPAALSFDPAGLEQQVNDPNAELYRNMGIVSEFLFQRAPTIWGGSNEIQRNIIAKHALGLG
ncbi:acyl-CoA dehydrogenase family protein [uncultured Sulfitobacter sp.]|uniref:acyl-CoA dehydrogenase family protein n=1 Tax=uncultured Sulfitobacter sp. TaxID=191468 RepID=UPI00261092FD|nr:acyl-CoA dehydrogenase family protein [uncultured Sulfitobacter sp.]